MEEVPKIQYLMRRGGRYSIRMRVPQDLLEAYAPTKEICVTPLVPATSRLQQAQILAVFWT